MPRFLVQRTFPDGLAIPVTADGAKTCLGVVENNTEESVTWITSYVSIDHTKTFCIYDGPSPESVERAALANGLPVDSISEVRLSRADGAATTLQRRDGGWFVAQRNYPADAAKLRVAARTGERTQRVHEANAKRPRR